MANGNSLYGARAKAAEAAVDCPVCGAKAGERCTRKRRKGGTKFMRGTHKKRVFLHEGKTPKKSNEVETETMTDEVLAKLVSRLSNDWNEEHSLNEFEARFCEEIPAKVERYGGMTPKQRDLAKEILNKLASFLVRENEEKEETPAPAPKKEKKETDQSKLAKQVVALVTKARKLATEHGMGLPIGYRSTKHLATLAALFKDADQAWKLWISGRVSASDHAKFVHGGLPHGDPKWAKGKDGDPVWYETCARILDAGLPVYLVGEAGCGKTRFAEWYAERNNKELHCVVGSGDRASRTLWVERRDIQEGRVDIIPGAAAKAAIDGDVLLLDEVDGFDPNALLPLNSLLNGDKKLNAPILGEVEVNSECRVIAAANTNGRSRDRTYAARNRMDGAFLNRFAVVIKVEFYEEIDEKVANAAILEVMKNEGWGDDDE